MPNRGGVISNSGCKAAPSRCNSAEYFGVSATASAAERALQRRRDLRRQSTADIRLVDGQRGRRQALGDQMQTLGAETQLPDQRLRHEMQQVGAGGDLEAGPELARDSSATDPFRRFQQQHRAAAAAR